MTPNAKILIVDDEPTAVQILHKTLSGMGAVRYAVSGTAALELVAAEPPDLVLLDVNMPGMDGFATCVVLRRDYPDIPVVFVTGGGDVDSEIRALEAGASDFITKPINPPVVRARVAMHLKFKAQSDLLRTLGRRDPLTGVANRRVLEESLVHAWRRAARHGLSLSLLMIDIDHFKAYNDFYGHLEGDLCLQRVAGALQQSTQRADDLLARYGGEEFAALLTGSRLDEAAALAERLRAAVHALAIPHACSSVSDHVTLSIGVASVQPASMPEPMPEQPLRHSYGIAAPVSTLAPLEVEQAPIAVSIAPKDPQQSGDQPSAAEQAASGFLLGRDLLERADRALYAAKEGGRDRVVLG